MAIAMLETTLVNVHNKSDNFDLQYDSQQISHTQRLGSNENFRCNKLNIPMPNTNMPKMPQTKAAAIPIPVGRIQERFGPDDAPCIGPVDTRKQARWIETHVNDGKATHT